MATDASSTHTRGSVPALSRAQTFRAMGKSSACVLLGPYSKYYAHVLCLGSYEGVVKGELKRLHSDPGNVTFQLYNLGK